MGITARSGSILMVAALALWGCTGDGISRANGQLSARASVDFGDVAVGRRKVEALTLQNLGAAPLTVLKVGLGEPAPADFVVKAPEGTVLAPGDSVQLTVAFAPVEVGKRAVRLVVDTDSPRTPEQQIELWGDGVLAKATLDPTSLDFGKVPIHAQAALALHLSNPGAQPAEVTVNTPSGDDGSFFSASPTGTVLVPPNGAVDLTVRFAPMRLGPYLATLSVQQCPSCAATSVSLQGEGIASALMADPPQLDFGNAQMGNTVLRTTHVTNLGTAAVTVLSIQPGSDTPADYVVKDAPTTSFSVPQNGSFDVQVAFTPSSLDHRIGSVRISYQDPSWDTAQELVVPLGGMGGGPQLTVVPNPLGFPRTAVGMEVDKHLVLRNDGTDPARPLVISDATVKLDPEFSLVSPPAWPVTLAPGASQALTVRYHPLLSGQAKGALEITSNDANAVQDVPLTGSASDLAPCRYDVVPSQLDFGAVAVNGRARLGFRIRNLGTDGCAVANVRVSDATPPEFALTNISTRVIDPGQSLTVPVEFAPDAEQNYVGEVDFDVSNPQAPHAQVMLTGRGVQGCLEVHPDHLDFGTVGLACQPPTKEVLLHNSCAANVDVKSAALGTGASDAFHIDPATAGEHIVAPGGEVPVRVTYQPTKEGTDLAPLFVTTDLYPTPLLVPLSGTAATRPLQTDTFAIPQQNKVDFLFVVDNSGSMTEEQNGIARNFDRFIQTALANHVDFHIAVTTTGLTPYRGGWADCPGGAYGGEAGRFFPVDNSRPRILTPTTPNLRDTFEQNVKVGVCHWWEEGLEATRLALTPPLSDNTDDPATPEPNDGNAGFLRPDAALYVLVVSDADDSDTYDVNNYIQLLQGMKPGRPDLVSFSGVIGLPTCSTIESVGTRYMQVIHALGGIVADICSPDWGGILEQIGNDAFAPQTTFPLSQAPDGTNITVTVDGVEVDPVAADGSTQWDFDATQGPHGTVVFAQAHTPGPGAVVEVTYPVPCP